MRPDRLACASVVALLAVAGPAWGQGAEEVERTMHRTTMPGQAVRIRAYTRWNSRCQQNGSPQFAVLTPPAHGTLDQRSEQVEIKGPPLPGSTDCRGKNLPGVAMWYVPQPGFTGTEQFQYRVSYGSLGRVDTVVVDVR